MVSLILGATKGLGLKIAKECWKAGDDTIEVGSSIQDDESERTIFIKCDLSSEESVRRLLHRIETVEVDRFFWVAGRLLKGNLSEHSVDEVLRTVDVNFRNSVLVAHAVWKQMQNATTPKTFTVIASSSGVKPRSDEAIYVATKHAQVGFTRSLGMENKNTNVKVSLVLPGGMQTPFWSGTDTPDLDSFLDPQKVAALIFRSVSAQQEPFMELEIPRGSL